MTALPQGYKLETFSNLQALWTAAKSVLDSLNANNEDGN